MECTVRPSHNAAFEDSHGVSVADVFAGSLDDGLTGLVERSVDAIVGSGVGFLHQVLELREENRTTSIKKIQVENSWRFVKRSVSCLFIPVNDFFHLLF